jgi:Protein of unknown function (DUF664)
VTQERPAGLDIPGELHRYLQEARDRVLSRLDGLGDYDIRRPLTPTGTNLLGLVKHLVSIEFGCRDPAKATAPARPRSLTRGKA